METMGVNVDQRYVDGRGENYTKAVERFEEKRFKELSCNPDCTHELGIVGQPELGIVGQRQVLKRNTMRSTWVVNTQWWVVNTLVCSKDLLVEVQG